MQPTIKKDALLKALKENLKLHDELHGEAVEKFWERVAADFEAKVTEARGLITNQQLDRGRVSIGISFSKPENHAKDYQAVIKMIEMEVEDVIELDEHEFRQYVLNDWNWKDEFLTSNAMYAAVGDTGPKGPGGGESWMDKARRF